MSEGTPADLEAMLTAAFVQNEAAREAREKRMGRAWWDASGCALCGRDLAATEAVWLVQLVYGRDRCSGDPRATQMAVCDPCAHDARNGMVPLADRKPGYTEGSCDGCGRPVHAGITGHPRRYFLCSEQCRRFIYTRNHGAKVRGAPVKPELTCPVCGRDFRATRSDAKTCSPKCKQKAYRTRRGGVTGEKVDAHTISHP